MKLDVSEEYLDSKCVEMYVYRCNEGIENRTLSEYLISEWEHSQMFLETDEVIINDLQRLLMKIKRLDSTPDEIKKEIDSTLVGMF